MHESSSRELVLDGAEADAVLEALRDHESNASDAEGGEMDELEAQFDRDLDDAANAEFELTRADARVVASALEERERVAGGRRTERLASIRERFAGAFDFEDRGADEPEPMDDEGYPGST